MHFLLLHSPLVTKESWMALVPALEAADCEATVVNLDNTVSSGQAYYEHHLAQVYAQIPDIPQRSIVAVAHSGAGSVLALLDPDRIGGYVFLDAIFPSAEASRFDLFDDSASIQAWRGIAGDNRDMLPRAMLVRFGSQIVDAELRAAFSAELVDVPVALFEEKIPVHSEWPPSRNGLYVRWTEAYRADAERAEAAGFEVRIDPAAHFNMLIQPRRVARALVEFGRTIEMDQTTKRR